MFHNSFKLKLRLYIYIYVDSLTDEMAKGQKPILKTF